MDELLKRFDELFSAAKKDSSAGASVRVWDIVTEIAAKKYGWYVDTLRPLITSKKKKKDMDCIVSRWESVRDGCDGTEKTAEFMRSDEFKADIEQLLKWYNSNIAHRAANIHSYIDRWKAASTIELKSVYMASEAFGFTAEETGVLLQKVLGNDRASILKKAAEDKLGIEETREILSRLIEPDGQNDFDPRSISDMVIMYGIMNGLPYFSEANDGKSISEMLVTARFRFLENLFGKELSEYFGELLTYETSGFDPTDAENLTRDAYILAVIKLFEEGRLTEEEKLDLLLDRKNESANKKNIGNIPKLMPDSSVTQLCYEWLMFDSEGELKENWTEDKLDTAKLGKKSTSYDDFFEYTGFVLETAVGEESSDSKKLLLTTMKDFLNNVQKSIKNTGKLSFTPFDILPLVMESSLGQFTTAEFNKMMKEILSEHMIMESRQGRQPSKYHGLTLALNESQSDYFDLVLDTVKLSVRSLRALSTRGLERLGYVYTEMNEILKYPFFDKNGVGVKFWDYRHRKLSDTYDMTVTMEMADDMIEEAEAGEPEMFLDLLLELGDRNVRRYERFLGPLSVSRSNELRHFLIGKTIVSDLVSEQQKDPKDPDKTKEIKLPKDPDALFARESAVKFVSIDDFRTKYYSPARFTNQYVSGFEEITRSDILKLAFWDHARRLDKDEPFDPMLRINEFEEEFREIAERIHCQNFDSRFLLDRFLMLCLEAPDPIEFMKAAYRHNEKAFSKIV